MPRVKAPPPPPSRMIDRPGRWKLLVRRQKRMVRPLLLAGTLLAVAGGCAFVIHAATRGAPLSERLGAATALAGLRIQEITLPKGLKTPEPLLRAALGATTGQSILAFSVSDARARIESLTWVQSATVERHLPGTIVVGITERRPFAVWQNQGKFVLIDRAGDVVADQDIAALASQLPLVVGAGAPAAAATLIDALATLPDVRARMVASVRIGERRWNLRMKNGADVMLPEAAEAQALAKLAELQTQLQILDRPMQSVDLRLPDRMVVRAQGSAPDKADKPADPPKSDAAHPIARRPT